MSIAIEPGGQWKSFAASLTTTSATSVYTLDTNAFAAICDAIHLCNVDASNPVDVTVAFYDSSATTAYTMMSASSLAAGSNHIFELALALEPGDEIRVTASNANDLVVVGRVKEYRR